MRYPAILLKSRGRVGYMIASGKQEAQSAAQSPPLAKEMGFRDQKEYERAAIDFRNSGEGTRYYSFARKVFCKYNPKTKHKVVVNEDGIILTFHLETSTSFERKKAWEKYERID